MCDVGDGIIYPECRDVMWEAMGWTRGTEARMTSFLKTRTANGCLMPPDMRTSISLFSEFVEGSIERETFPHQLG